MKILIPVLLALLVGGCAVVPADSVSNSGTRCTKEAPLGSNIAVTKCRSAEDIEREKAEASTMGDPLKRGKSGMRGEP